MQSFYLFLSLLLCVVATQAQQIGSSQAGGKTPGDVSAASLDGGGLSGDVNVFNGTYSASYPLGAVSTPGGLSFALSLSYNNQFTSGSTPPIISGVPYGEGWSCNVPMISVSTDVFQKYTQYQACQLEQLPGSTRTYAVTEAQQEGEVYWFAPNLTIPGVGGGRMVLKSVESATGGDATFVCNAFEDYVEARFTGGTWIVSLSDGTVYEFDLIQTGYRNASAQRTFDYNDTEDIINNGPTGVQNMGLQAQTLPTEEATVCLLYTSPSPRDGATSRMPSSA